MKNFSHIKDWYNKQPQADKDKLPALFAGVGLILILLQTLPLGYPIAGYVFIALSLVIALLIGKKITLGPKWMYIPLLVIVGTIFLRAIVYDVTVGTFEIGFISLMFCAYLAGRVCGRDIFFAIPYVVLLLSLSVYMNVVSTQGLPTVTLDYNLTSAVLILGTVVTTWQRKWIVVLFALPALFLTGASQCILAFVVIGIIVILRKDWSRKMLLPAGALSVALIATFFGGILDNLYARSFSIINDNTDSPAVFMRADGYILALTSFSFLGNGYDPTNTIDARENIESIHNTPLRVLYELGPIAMIAWCFAMLVGLIKTRYKYAFAAILAFSLFDHLMWTWLAPLPWLVAGVATVDNEGDLLFRKETI